MNFSLYCLNFRSLFKLFFLFSVKMTLLNCTMIDVQNATITTDFVFAWYQKVEYIESNWNQYIDSLYKPNYNSKIYAKFAHNEHVLDTPIFWARTSSWQNSFVLWSHPSNYTWWTWLSQCLFNWNNKTNISWYYEWTIIEFQYDKNSWYYWSTTWTWSNSSWWPNLNLAIFWLRNGSEIDQRKFSWKMFSFKIWENNSLIRDFYPVYRKSDNVIWLLDKLNKQFYTNQWSWSFTKWPNI